MTTPSSRLSQSKARPSEADQGASEPRDAHDDPDAALDHDAGDIFARGTGTHARAPTAMRTAFAEDLADLEVKFSRSLERFTMAFQPIVHATDHRLFGYEALLRAGDAALPHPGAILDAAERLNRTTKLGRAVRARVARAINAAGPEHGVFFINLHVLDLLDTTLSSSFSPLAKVADRVVLEITERASLDAVTDIRFRVAELRALGFRIAIDDLGAGCVRMKDFSLLDTNFVKLDMSLVRDVDTHPMKQQLIASMTALCREQGILVIGEGVETRAEERVLTDLGCDLLQGYLIARPGPAFPAVLPR